MLRLLSLFLVALSFGNFGCKKKKPAGPKIKDPYAYVKAELQKTEPRWFRTGKGGKEFSSKYNLDDKASIDDAISSGMKRRHEDWKGKLPFYQSQLDDFVKEIDGYYHKTIIHDPVLRSKVEEKMRLYFAEPPVALKNNGVAYAHFGVAPGRIDKITRAGWGIVESDVSKGTELTPQSVAKCFAYLVEKFPDAKGYEFEVFVTKITTKIVYKYLFLKARDVLEIQHTGRGRKNFFASKKKIGGIQAILEKRTPLRYLELQNLNSDQISRPHRENERFHGRRGIRDTRKNAK